MLVRQLKKNYTATNTCFVFFLFFLAGQLIEMFRNVEELKEELRRTTGMSNRSIDSLLAVPIPDNRAEVGQDVFVLTARS